MVDDLCTAPLMKHCVKPDTTVTARCSLLCYNALGTKALGLLENVGNEGFMYSQVDVLNRHYEKLTADLGKGEDTGAHKSHPTKRICNSMNGASPPASQLWIGRCAVH